MKKEFPYLKKEKQYFPLIEVLLKNRRKSINTKALIDSGACFSLFHYEIAEYLDIDLQKGKKIYLTGIGGRILGYLHTISITIGNKTFPCKIVFSPEFTVSFNLLGRDNFFLPFIISFMEKQKKVVISSA